MTQYRRNQSQLKGVGIDSTQMRAAVNLVISVKDGKPPDIESLNVLADAFLEVFGGKHPKALFGSSIGLVHGPGRRPDYGFTPSDIVSAVIEIELRRLQYKRGALSAAKKIALESFIDISGENAARSIERDWAAGKKTVKSLSISELYELIRPYKT